MPESTELKVMLKYAGGFVHDIHKYLGPLVWGFTIGYCNSKDKDFLAARKAHSEIGRNYKVMERLLYQKKINSMEFKESVINLSKNAAVFLRALGKFVKSGNCPPKFAKTFVNFNLAFKMVIPLCRVLAEGKLKLRKRKVRLRALLEEILPWASGCPIEIGIGREAYFGPAKFSIRVEGDPVVYADPLHLQRAMFNVLHDAIIHSKGEPVTISLRATKRNAVFSTTNVGRMVEREALSKIGKVPYTTRKIMVLHGFGKVAARDAIKAHGGKFRKRNAPQGFRISLAIPLKRRKRVA